MQTSCIFVASGFVIDPQILIFSVFSIASFFAVLIANKNFPCHCSFTCLLLRSICGMEIRHRADITAVSVNDQHAIQRRVQNFNKNT